jgi:putative transposase
MPRPPRLFVPNGIYHLAAHGSDRRALFLCDRDRALFLERLAQVCERHELALIAYCLMGNHYHLVAQTADARLSLALKELNGGYSRQFNRLHGRSAHLIRAHALAELIEQESYLLTVCRYLAWNPVGAGLCGEPCEWPWSSYQASAGLEPVPRFLNDSALRDACGGRADWRQRYRDFVEAEPRRETSLTAAEAATSSAQAAT